MSRPNKPGRAGGRHARDVEAGDAPTGAISRRPVERTAALRRLDARELLLVTVAGAGGSSDQRCWFVLLRPASGGRLIAGGLVDEAVERLLAARPDAQATALEPFCDELAERLVVAVERTRAAGMAIAPELRDVLALALPSGMQSAAEPAPDLGGDDLRVHALDDGAKLSSLMTELLAEFDSATPEDPGDSVWRSGDLVGGAMIEFKGRYADGRLACWTVADVREFMLTWLPGMVQTDAAVVADVPDCVCAFLHFMSERGSLVGDPLAELESVARSVAAELPQRFAQVQRSGLAADVARHLRSSHDA